MYCLVGRKYEFIIIVQSMHMHNKNQLRSVATISLYEQQRDRWYFFREYWLSVMLSITKYTKCRFNRRKTTITSIFDKILYTEKKSKSHSIKLMIHLSLLNRAIIKPFFDCFLEREINWIALVFQQHLAFAAQIIQYIYLPIFVFSRKLLLYRQATIYCRYISYSEPSAL